MRREVKKLLWDAAHSAAVLVDAVAGRTVDSLTADEFFRGGVERRFEVIGEALRKALALDPGIAHHITDVHQIIGLRHVIAHEYDNIDYAAIWRILQTEVPVLRRELEALLAESS